MIETYGAAPMVADSLGYSYNLISDNLSIYSRYPIIRKYAFADSISTFNFGGVMIDAPMIEIEEGLRKAKQHLQYMCTRAVWLLQHKEDKKDKLVSPLTVTEREILKLMALGKTTKEIAAERFLSVYTVMTHRKNIFRKLEVNNVHEATKYALRAGIVDVVEYYI
jgi:two-component system, NarL family, response regulator LiaR